MSRYVVCIFSPVRWGKTFSFFVLSIRNDSTSFEVFSSDWHFILRLLQKVSLLVGETLVKMFKASSSSFSRRDAT